MKPPLISCLCPTFNRYPKLHYLLEAAVECFLRQDYPNKELILCNDTEGQDVTFDHPQVRVFNFRDVGYRLPDLSAKVQWMIDHSEGQLLCRWDDDDISLPHRLSYSFEKLSTVPYDAIASSLGIYGRLEWRAENHFYDHQGLHHVMSPGNTHVQALWDRTVHERFPYPAGFSGGEDQDFNRLLAVHGISLKGEAIPPAEVYYLYRWATGSRHLSGVGGGLEGSRQHWRDRGKEEVAQGTFQIRPRWYQDHVGRVAAWVNSQQPARVLAAVRGL